jgi:hypothetical protein
MRCAFVVRLLSETEVRRPEAVRYANKKSLNAKAMR